MGTDPQLHAEQRARVEIDRKLELAGWQVQNYRDIDLSTPAAAVREFPTKTGPVDYMLFVDGKAIGTIEAKKEGVPLLGVEPQTQRYIEGFNLLVRERPIPRWELPLPFHYQSTGAETNFTDMRDPAPRPRAVFAFHQPETLARWAKDEFPLRARLRRMPSLEAGMLREAQIEAITNLEESLRDDRPKALIDMTMGAGKTFVAVAESYRLLRYGGAERILFLVDRINLGKQAYDEFADYVTPDDGRKFTELYNVQVLRSNRIDPATKVVITTIQRLYSILRGQRDDEFDPASEEVSSFELAAASDEPPLEVDYQPSTAIETFDFCWIDECHRSIYGKWGQVLDYFDSFKIGLTGTAEHTTRIYFDQNVVSEYRHEQAVIDGVNVPYSTYRIKTEVTERGGKVEAGEWVEVRDTQTRRVERRQLEDELTYERSALDRAVTNPDQIRTVVREFRNKVLTEIFPGRKDVPKTVFFCKTDNHAEDVLRIVREEFARGSDFARKITYKTEGDSNQHIQDFRTDPRFRIAVTVDQIATGTDIRALECLVFMRMVNSRTLFEQMKGRGSRVINPDDLQSVSEGAVSKDRFVIVDTVGLTDEEKAWVESRPLERKPSVPLKDLLQSIGNGIKDEATVSSVGSRLSQLAHALDDEKQQEFSDVAEGRSLEDVARTLVESTDPEYWAADAGRAAGVADEDDYEPTAQELDDAKGRLIDAAVKPLMKPAVRRSIENLRERHLQTIDRTTQDRVISAGWSDAGAAMDATTAFELWIKENHDEYVALQAYYARPYRLRPSLKDLRELQEAIEAPPISLTPERLWAAYEAVDADKVKGAGVRRTLTDLVQLVRFAMHHEDELAPRKEVVMLRFDIWLDEQRRLGREFTSQQLEWLQWMAEHIAGSMSLEREDFDLDPFAQEGGLLGAHETFGNELDKLIEELNLELAAA